MKTRRQFLSAAGSTLAVGSLHASTTGQESSLFRFGLMADCQYMDAEPRGHNFYRESPRKLSEAINAMNESKVEFSFHIGDFIDRDFASFDVLDPIAARHEKKLYHALGNHDYSVLKPLKEKVPARLGLEKTYYSFSHEGCRFIVTDPTELSMYSSLPPNEMFLAAKIELEKITAPGGVAEHADERIRYSSRPSDQQIVWIESELIAAQAAGEIAIILGHHPVLPDNALSLWQPALFDSLFQKHRCAKAYICGHNHSGSYRDSNGFHYLTLDGMLPTEKENAFAIAELYSDRLEIKGTGRQPSHSLKFRESSFV